MINLNQELKTLEGKPFLEEDNSVLVLKKILLRAIGSFTQDDTNMPGEKKVQLYNLGQKIASSDELELKSEEIVALKGRVSKFFNIVVYGQVAEMLEGGK